MTYFLLNNDNQHLGDYHSKELEDPQMINHPSFISYSYELEEQSNREQFARIFKENPLKNVIEPRQCSTSICHMDLRNDKFCSKIVQEDVKDSDNTFSPVAVISPKYKMELTSGKDDPSKYFEAIDIESKLKNIDYKTNSCYVKDYKENSSISTNPYNNVFDKDYRIPLRVMGDMSCGTFDNDGDFTLHINTSSKFRTSE